MSDDVSGGWDHGPEGGPEQSGVSDPLDGLLETLIGHVEDGGTASLEAIVADSEVRSMEELFERLRRREHVTDLEATALVNAATGETVEEVRSALGGVQTEPPADDEPAETPVSHPALSELQGASNVLVLCPSKTAVEDSVCRSLLTDVSPSEQNVLVVSVTGNSEDRLALLQEGGRDLPANVAVVGGRSGVRTTTTAPKEGSSSTTITLESMPNPADLPKLGITIGRLVGEWEGNDRETAVCFHSLTALLQYVDRQRMFRFIRVLQDRLAAVGGVTHYHMDPEAHERQTIATFRSLFDAVVEVTPNGEVRVTG